MMKFKPLLGILNAHTNFTFHINFFKIQVYLKTKDTHILMDKYIHTLTSKERYKLRKKIYSPANSTAD